MNRRRTWRPIVVAALAALALGILGAITTELGSWYYSLNKPSWQPPDWLFGPVWTTIFALSAIAGVLAWNNTTNRAGRDRVLLLFAANAFMSVLWSGLFFRMHRPDWAFYEVGFLWLSVLALIIGLAKFSKSASGLIVPYLLWVSFAAYLNWVIIHLNGFV